MINSLKRCFTVCTCIFSKAKDVCKKSRENMWVKQNKKIKNKSFIKESLYLEGRWHGFSINNEQRYYFKLEFDFYIDKLGKFTGFGIMTPIKLSPNKRIESIEDTKEVFTNKQYTVDNEINIEPLAISGSHHNKVIIVTYESKDSLTTYYGTSMLYYDTSIDKGLVGDVLGGRLENGLKAKSKIFLIKKTP